MQDDRKWRVTELEMSKTKRQLKKPEIQPVKKVYARPRLVEYGNVAKLTASGGTHLPVDSMVGMFG
jgi:hypothetical protein